MLPSKADFSQNLPAQRFDDRFELEVEHPVTGRLSVNDAGAPSIRLARHVGEPFPCAGRDVAAVNDVAAGVG